MKISVLKLSAAAATIILLFSSCHETTPQEQLAKIGINYFSINQYIYDQWKNFNGHPFAILKTTMVNGKVVDSTYTNSEKMDWVSVIRIFMETDISDPELLGHYKFSQFEDEQDHTVDFFYEAVDDKLTLTNIMDKTLELNTRKLLVAANPFTQRIQGIYIETHQHSVFMGDVSQKLYYAPYSTVQIQRYETPVLGRKKSTVIRYYFLP